MKKWLYAWCVTNSNDREPYAISGLSEVSASTRKEAAETAMEEIKGKFPEHSYEKASPWYDHQITVSYLPVN